MSRQNPFDLQNIQESTLDKPPGLLEQLNLPPDVIRFIRRNQRTIWIVTGCVALVVVVAALYNQYSDYRERKGASALSVALKTEESSEKKKMLAEVADEFGGSSAGLWARIELAGIAAGEGKTGDAIRQYEEVRNDVSPRNPVVPLLLNALGVLYEKDGDLDKAVAAFTELHSYPGFEVDASIALGRLYEEKGDRAKALEYYRKALGEENAAAGDQPGNPDREIIEARISRLQD
ncbi:MAG: hypothetical protein Kow0089_19690 [Desulfobulbaceae bacterium]